MHLPCCCCFGLIENVFNSHFPFVFLMIVNWLSSFLFNIHIDNSQGRMYRVINIVKHDFSLVNELSFTHSSLFFACMCVCVCASCGCIPATLLLVVTEQLMHYSWSNATSKGKESRKKKNVNEKKTTWCLSAFFFLFYN